jgi:hypothetical protein
VSWQPRAGIELAVVGRNLHQDRHLEWPADAGSSVQIRRSVLATVTVRR